jgi:hypothetical protein
MGLDPRTASETKLWLGRGNHTGIDAKKVCP